jgi:hypothetical protein
VCSFTAAAINSQCQPSVWSGLHHHQAQSMLWCVNPYVQVLLLLLLLNSVTAMVRYPEGNDRSPVILKGRYWLRVVLICCHICYTIAVADAQSLLPLTGGVAGQLPGSTAHAVVPHAISSKAAAAAELSGCCPRLRQPQCEPQIPLGYRCSITTAINSRCCQPSV